MVVFSSFLALALLVARVGADHAHHALAANDAAVLANATNGATYFHVVYSTFVVERMDIISKISPCDKGVNWEKLKVECARMKIPPKMKKPADGQSATVRPWCLRVHPPEKVFA